MFTEIRFYSRPLDVIRAIARLNINVEAMVLNRDTGEYRIVIKNGDLPRATTLFKRNNLPYCLTSVQLVPILPVPGQIASVLEEIHRGAYYAENNRLVLRNENICK